MTPAGRHYTFRDARLREEVAHDGDGLILTQRIEDHRTPGAANFLDLTVLPPGTTIGVHTHGPADEEYYIVITGRGRMRLEEEEFEVGPGDVIVNNRCGTHGLANIGAEPIQLVVIEVPATPLGHEDQAASSSP
jgi:mannose-6-phosphate isomerase-like protein (cupin superfamily)